MAHRALKARALVATTVLSACGQPALAPQNVVVPSPSAVPASALDYPTDAWGSFHSKRFQLTIPLPDGRAWKIDDHRAPELVAVHAPTDSRLTIAVSREDELMNRQRCEQRARLRGWVPTTPLSTVEDEVRTGPEAYDSRVWVAIGTSPPRGPADAPPIEGHVFLFGAFLRTCLTVHLTTRAPPDAEAVLASRLAIASSRIVKAIALDPLRTTDEATVPRDKADIRR